MSLSDLIRLAPLKRWRHRASEEAAVKPSEAPEAPDVETRDLSGERRIPDGRQFLLALARQAIVSAAQNLPRPEPGPLTPELAEPKACFVTLTKAGALRGCIGNLAPDLPLANAVILNAVGAATRDPRFPPVEPREVGEIRIEISVLTVPRRVEFGSPEQLLERVRPGTDGVLLRVEGRTATFLPQVWETVPDRTAFLNRLALKAGLDPAAWRRPDAEISVYEVDSFAEPDKEG